MQTSSRRAVIATALAGLAAGCAPVALAATSPDATLMQAGAEFDRCLAEYEAAEARSRAALRIARDDPFTRELGGIVEDMCAALEASADRVMAIQPTTLAGLALWAWIMCWRFDADLRRIPAEAPSDIAQFGVNEAFALAVAIDRMASQARGMAS
jgi:hypothetical protein